MTDGRTGGQRDTPPIAKSRPSITEHDKKSVPRIRRVNGWLYLATRNTFCRTRSLSNATFSFLITWRSCSSKSAAVNKISWNRMIFHWDMAIYRFSKWRPSAILELFYHHTRPDHPQSLLLAAAACQISCQSDTQIWRYSYLIFSHIWLEIFRPPKWGFCGTLDP